MMEQQLLGIRIEQMDCNHPLVASYLVQLELIVRIVVDWILESMLGLHWKMVVLVGLQ